MSFLIENILKDKKIEKQSNVKSKRDDEKVIITDSNQTERKLIVENPCPIKGNNLLNYHSFPYVSSQVQKPERERAVEKNSFMSFLNPKDNYCCSRSSHVATHDEMYHPPYIYPDKIYSQIPFNAIVPMSFPMYTYYSRRRNQVRFSTSQTKALESKFSWQKYLSPEDRKSLAYSLKLSDRQVKTWFQNRRAKWRRNVNGSSNGDMRDT